MSTIQQLCADSTDMACISAAQPTTQPSYPNPRLLRLGLDTRLTEEILKQRKLRHCTLTRFARHRRTVIYKADQLHRDCQADVYLVVRWEGKTYTYKSSTDKDWPPPEEELLKRWPITEVAGPALIAKAKGHRAAAKAAK